MPIFTKDSLESLRQKIDLTDVISSHIELKKSGAAYKGTCPFHDEKTPSFMIQKGDRHYHCFGCGAHGDAIQFLMNHLKVSFSDAVESLAEKFHVHLDKMDDVAESKGPSKSLLKESLSYASLFYHFYLLHTTVGHQVLEYLYSRGLDLDFIQQFEIGLAPKTAGLMRRVLHAKFVKDETMLAAGLLSETKDGHYRDFFLERITFPIRDVSGAIIGFSARKYKEETFGGKYVNTQETALFKKSRVLFGLNYSRKKIAKESKAIIVEGQIDALRLIQEGFNYTVAGQGTAFGESHAKELLNLGVNTVFLAMDADLAGQMATAKIGNIFQKEGVEVKVVVMPEGKDPDLFLREYGPESFNLLLEQSKDYLNFLVKYHAKEMDMTSPAAKNRLVDLIAKQIRDWEHPVMVSESLKKLAHLAQVPESMVMSGVSFTPNLYIKKSESVGLEAIDPHRILELDFLRWLLLTPQGRESFCVIAKHNIEIHDLRVEICCKMYAALIEAFDNQEPTDPISLILKIDDPEAQVLIAELHDKKINKEKAEEQFRDTVQKILNRNWMEKCEQVKIKIHSGQQSDDEALKLLQEYNMLRKQTPKLILPDST